VEETRQSEPGKERRNADAKKTRPGCGRFGDLLDLQIARTTKSDEIPLKGRRRVSFPRPSTSCSERLFRAAARSPQVGGQHAGAADKCQRDCWIFRRIGATGLGAQSGGSCEQRCHGENYECELSHRFPFRNEICKNDLSTHLTLDIEILE
jgi:hypothetical protein